MRRWEKLYDNINDYDLLDKVSDNEMATERLFEKYKPLINKIASKAYYKNKKSGLELNDLIQEGMIGFSVALNTYSDNKDASFFTFARMCIIRKISSSITKAKRQKHLILNESISVENISDDLNKKEKIFTDNESNPENILIIDEKIKEIKNNIEKDLTNLEKEVFELKTAGFNYKEIAELLEKTPKSIDNTISRIRIKTNKYLNENKLN